MVDRAAPAGTQIEAFSWLLTASSTGAAGAAVAGALAQSAGAPAAFAFTGTAGGFAILIATLGSGSLDNATARRTGALLATHRLTRSKGLPPRATAGARPPLHESHIRCARSALWFSCEI